MELKLENYTIKTKEKITWKDIFQYESLVFSETTQSWDVLLFFIDSLIEEIIIKDKTIKDKKELEDVIFSPEKTLRKDLSTIIDNITDLLIEKKN